MQNLSPVEWALRPVKKYAVFSGRAARAEFWWYRILAGVAGFGTGVADAMVGDPIVGDYGPTTLMLMLALIVPNLAVTVRRLHDIGRSGLWAVLSIVNYAFVVVSLGGFRESFASTINAVVLGILLIGFLIAGIVMFVFMVTPGSEGTNDYGPDPYSPDALEEVFA